MGRKKRSGRPVPRGTKKYVYKTLRGVTVKGKIPGAKRKIIAGAKTRRVSVIGYPTTVLEKEIYYTPKRKLKRVKKVSKKIKKLVVVSDKYAVDTGIRIPVLQRTMEEVQPISPGKIRRGETIREYKKRVSAADTSAKQIRELKRTEKKLKRAGFKRITTTRRLRRLEFQKRRKEPHEEITRITYYRKPKRKPVLTPTGRRKRIRGETKITKFKREAQSILPKKLQGKRGMRLLRSLGLTRAGQALEAYKEERPITGEAILRKEGLIVTKRRKRAYKRKLRARRKR